MLRHEQHLHLQSRSLAAVLSAAAGDVTRVSAVPLARTAGDEASALRPNGWLIGWFTCAWQVGCSKPKQFVLGGRGALGLIPNASWGGGKATV